MKKEILYKRKRGFQKISIYFLRLIIIKNVLIGACFSQDSSILRLSIINDTSRLKEGTVYGPNKLTDEDYSINSNTKVTRTTLINGNGKSVMSEREYVNGVLNGYSIYYFFNGRIREINYYSNGKLSETIFRAGSDGKLLYPGNVKRGTGIKFFSGYQGLEKNCYVTYKDGVPKGPFYVRTGDEIVEGFLAYSLHCVNYSPAKKMTYVTARHDTVTGIFDERDVYSSLLSDSSLKILSSANDSIADNPRDFMELSYGFDDPAVIPKGICHVIDFKTKKVIKEIEYDTSGNAIHIKSFSKEGKLQWERTYAPCSKRKKVRLNKDGTFDSEYCDLKPMVYKE